jgi:hypothetical protein
LRQVSQAINTPLYHNKIEEFNDLTIYRPDGCKGLSRGPEPGTIRAGCSTEIAMLLDWLAMAFLKSIARQNRYVARL